MTFTTPIHTNEQSIDRVLAAGLPVLLVFWRPDCQPCTQLNPTLDRLAQTYAGKLLIAKVNVDDSPALAERYTAAQLPALRFVKDGRIVAEGAGATAEGNLRNWIDAALRGGSIPPIHGTTVPRQATSRPQSAPAPHGTSTAHAQNGQVQPIVLTDATFDQMVGQNTLPVLVDFWAPWCGPCRMVAPAVEQLAREFAGRAVVGKLNIDENQRVAQRFGIMSIPALYVFKRGQVVERLVGAQPASVLRHALQRHVA